MDNPTPFDNILPDTSDIYQLFDSVVAQTSDLNLRNFNYFSNEEKNKIHDFVVAPIAYLLKYSKHPTLMTIAQFGQRSIQGSTTGVEMTIVATPLYMVDSFVSSLSAIELMQNVTKNSGLIKEYLSLTKSYNDAQTYLGQEIASNTIILFEYELIDKHPDLGRPICVIRDSKLVILISHHLANIAKKNPLEAVLRIIYACSRARDFANRRHEFESELLMTERAVVAQAQFLVELVGSQPDVRLGEYEQSLLNACPSGFDSINLPEGINY